jgi:two-component system, NtrC family, sensor kinase
MPATQPSQSISHLTPAPPALSHEALRQSAWHGVDYGICILRVQTSPVPAESLTLEMIDCNPVWQQMHGLTASPPIPSRLDQILPPAIVDLYQPPCMATVQSGQSSAVEQAVPITCQNPGADQSDQAHAHTQHPEVWWSFRVSRLQNPAASAGIDHLVVTLTDISDRKQQDAIQRQTTEQYHAIVTAIPDLMFRLNPDGIYLGYVPNHQFIDLLPPNAQPTGKHIKELVPPNIAEQHLLHLKTAMATGEVQVYEQYVGQVDAELCEEVRAVPCGKDEVLFMVRYIGDLKRNEAQRKQAEAALAESEANFRSLVENAISMIFRLDTAGILTYASPKFKELVGYNPHDLEGQSFRDLLHPDDAARCACALQQILEPGQSYSGLEYRVYHEQGDWRWHTANVTGLWDEAGKCLGWLGAANDITDRKQAEVALQESEAHLRQQTQALETTLRELKQTQARLVQTEKMSSLGQMVAGIAHEINNPVSFISGNLEHAQTYIQDLLTMVHLYQQTYPEPTEDIQTMAHSIDLAFLREDLPKLLADMTVGADRIREIVLSLRTFSRLDEAEYKAVQIHDGIDSTLMILNSRLKAQRDRPAITVIKDYEDLPLVECYGGPLNQVFMNLLINAIDALDEAWGIKSPRQPRLTLDDPEPNHPTLYIQTQRQEQTVQITIADNGPGIPASIQPRIFDPFFTTKSLGKGTGMGLSISYQIITERHNGNLRCFSTPAMGTEFIIQIPIQQRGKPN